MESWWGRFDSAIDWNPQDMGSEASKTTSEYEQQSAPLRRQRMASRWRSVGRPGGEAATYTISTTLFLRFLGVVYLIAFTSLWVQIDGLVGSGGIIPAAEYLSAVEQHCAAENPPQSPLWRVPTWAWVSSSDFFLHLLCGLGVALSVLLMLGIGPLPVLILLWTCYLSLYQVGQVFLSFQWDILLLETGFLALFLAPRCLRSRCFRDPEPPRLAIWLVWWLLFRLMFESGVVKLTWNNGSMPLEFNTWEALTAMDFHYWTQPLPLHTSWYASHLPAWIQKISVVVVLFIELAIPFFIFAPPLLRRIACGAFVFLMAVISTTGNYNFFNPLTILLALTLLDDAVWPKFMKNRIVPTTEAGVLSWKSWKTYLLWPFFAYVVFLGSLQVYTALFPTARWSRSLAAKIDVSQFHLVNSYGLFRRMTETRPEIIIEGSNDGKNWRAYQFIWKPGDLSRAPRVNAPHQPRLDWQMWFEALRFEQIFEATGTVDPRYMSPWFRAFLTRLIEQRPEVVKLIKTDPFPKHAPKFFRLALYQYQFTDSQERRETGNWWQRELQWLSPAYTAP